MPRSSSGVSPIGDMRRTKCSDRNRDHGLDRYIASKHDKMYDDGLQPELMGVRQQCLAMVTARFGHSESTRLRLVQPRNDGMQPIWR